MAYITVRQEGKIHVIRFENGGHVAEKLHVTGQCDLGDTGTSVTFQPDPEIFQETTEYDYDIIKARLREMAFLTKGLKISLTDLREEGKQENGEPRKDVFHYEGGIKEYVSYLCCCRSTPLAFRISKIL